MFLRGICKTLCPVSANWMKSRINRHLCINSPYKLEETYKIALYPHLSRHYLDCRTWRIEAFIRDYVKCISFRDDWNWMSFISKKTFIPRQFLFAISCKCNSCPPFINPWLHFHNSLFQTPMFFQFPSGWSFTEAINSLI